MMIFFDVLRELSNVHIRMNGKGYSDLIHFDLKNKRISNGNIVLYENGKVIPQVIKLHDYSIELTEDMTPEVKDGSWEAVEALYGAYRTSVPEQHDGHSKCNFVAKGLDELTNDEFQKGVKRQHARVNLEAYIMFHRLPWVEGHHYRQGKNDKSLVVFKEWVTPQGENL